jgi:hypothetical protein
LRRQSKHLPFPNPNSSFPGCFPSFLATEALCFVRATDGRCGLFLSPSHDCRRYELHRDLKADRFHLTTLESSVLFPSLCPDRSGRRQASCHRCDISHRSFRKLPPAVPPNVPFFTHPVLKSRACLSALNSMDPFQTSCALKALGP